MIFKEFFLPIPLRQSKVIEFTGNLETIYLRELQLNKLKELLKTLRFKEAALMMKKHRIDMNLFYDNDPAVSSFYNHNLLKPLRIQH